ncbi:peptide-methionine (S)-S-oxide reductase MsrA [Tundrisphaera lichenicola]|uniref:peptide-methionine (S)-S-oxide reductase MsrA n=1 Tax=Tundrisphaera lichenicola TaxID=2029860 RepID=UPI003EBA0B2E
MTLRILASSLGIAAVFGLAALVPAQEPSKDPAPAPATPKTEDAKKADPAETPKDKTDAEKPEKVGPKIEYATFGGGCFWCLEAFFERVKGVKEVVSGYAGGNVAKPSYEMVCTGLTGHAEVVTIQYDANVVSYDDLLDIFWICHDPTTQDRQGPDVGPQYRSIILYHNEEQKKLAQKSYEKVTSSGLYRDPIVTQLVPLAKFYPAEKYHQNYFRNNANKNPYCATVIAPKIAELRMKLNAKAAAKAK